MIIGIAGYAQSGKDTLFSLLQKDSPESFVRFAFADALKKEIAPSLESEFGIDVFNASPEEKTKIRPALVELGARRRAENQDYWVNLVGQEIEILDKNKHAVITDVRYMNEANWVLDNGGKIIVLSRFGGGPANKEEAQFTSPLYGLIGANIIPIVWSDLKNYSELDLDTLITVLKNELIS